MIRTAVILTVFNRREVTLKGLRTLYRAIEFLQKEQPDDVFQFDIFMTDDGCTDGTSEAVSAEFPEINIIQGDGNLYWSGGMRKAWKEAIDTGIKYDYYLWFNDDADLYDDALVTLFSSMKQVNGDCIISGAFCDTDGNVSYGGRDRRNDLLSPNGKLQKIYLMNGNLVLIPQLLVKVLGNINMIYTHSLGDWDYGCRAINAGFNVMITRKYVGVTDRHDGIIELYREKSIPILRRLRLLYSPRYNVIATFMFDLKFQGLIRAFRNIIIFHIYAILPIVYNIVHKK